MNRGDAKSAWLAAYQRALEFDEQLAGDDPHNAQAQRDLSVALLKVGDAHYRAGVFVSALAAYKRAHDICEKLAKDDPWNAQAQSDLAFACDSIADAHLRLGDNKLALAAQQRSVEIRDKLANAGLSSAKAQRELAQSFVVIGDFHLRRGDSKSALAAFQHALEIHEKLPDNPRSSVDQRELSIVFDKIGDVQFQRGESSSALAAYQHSQQIREQLAQNSPQNPGTQHDLLVSCYNLANLEQRSRRFSQASAWYTKAVDAAKAMAKPDSQHLLWLVERRLRFCQAMEIALDDPDAALKQSSELRVEVLRAAVYTLASQHEAAKTAKAADRLAAAAEQPEAIYDAACGFALCVPLVESASSKEKYGRRAVELLERAVSQGYKNAEYLKHDVDLDALRPQEDYQKLLALLAVKSPPRNEPAEKK